MAIRKDGIVITEELAEKLNMMSFSNDTNQPYSLEEVYIAKLINDNGFNFNNLRSTYIFDINSKCVKMNTANDGSISCFNLSNGERTSLDADKCLILPTWPEVREWLKNQNFKMEFHYDPFKDNNIKLGFMKPKFLSGTDNIVIEAQGKTDLEAIYKILLEVIKYEKEPKA